MAMPRSKYCTKAVLRVPFDGTNNTPSIGLPASGNNVVKIASFTATNTGTNPVIATLTVTPKLTQNGLTCTGKADTFTITVNPSPKPQITGSLSFCAGKSTTLTASGGNTYTWAPGGTAGADLNVNTAGVYTVTASTTLGCTASTTAQVTALTPPSPSFGPSNVFAVCPGQSVTLNPGTFKQYAWSSGVSTNTLTVPSTPNQYTVTVTDNNNCTAVGTAGVTELPQVGISIAIPDTLTCTVTQITLDGSGSSSGQFISYAWSTTNGQVISGATSNKAIIGKPGNYRFIVSSSLSTFCPDTTTITVIEQKQTASDAVLNLKDPGCKGLTDGSLQVGNITGGLAPFAFSLNGGLFFSTNTFNNLAPGNYALTIRSRNGCDFVKNFSIKEGTGPQPGISDQTVCPDAAATFDGGNFAQWQWSNSSTQKTTSITQPGTYFITVTDAKGCTGTDSFTLQNHPAVTASATAPEKLTCSKGQVSIGSAGSSTGAGITYTWTTANGTIQSGANSPSATVTEGGSYQLVVQNSQTNCADTATANVVEEGKQITGIDLQVLDVQCFADSNGQIIVAAVGSGAAPFTYKLNNGTFQNGDEFDNLKPGTYTLTVRGADGCEAQAGTTLKAPAKITVSITAPADKLSPGSNAKLPSTLTGAQGTVTYAWEGPALSCTNCVEPSVSPIFLSRYTLTVTDAQGCTASAFAIVDVNSDKGQDIITPDDDGINDGLEFEELNTEPAKSMNDIIIFNRWGQPVYTAKPYANEWTGKDKSGNNLPEGTYYYVLNLRDGQKEVIYGSVLLVR
jgi:gliding motility-associated-like protein